MNRLLAMTILGLAALWPGRAATAAELCVQTLDDLLDGLAIAALGPQPDGTMTLRLVAQTYAWSGSGGGGLDIYNSWSRLNLLGGYNADCSARTVDAHNTVLDGLGQLGLVLSTRGEAITVEGIRFQNLAQLSLENRTSCTEQGERFTFRRNIVLAGPAFGFSVECNDVRLENNLVIGGGDRYLQTYDGDAARAFYAVNNTFVNGTGDGLSLLRGPDSGALEVRLYNNILWNNAGNGLVQYPGSEPIVVRAYRNTWDGNGVPLTVNDGNSSSDPQLDATHRPVEPGSPAINSGLIGITGGLPGVDLDGGPRVIGSSVDRGAYESAVDNSQVLVVTHTHDAGAGSLRQAILNANASPNLTNRIVFQLPSCPGIIDLESSLPGITDSLIVDGYSQAGSSPNTSAIGNNAVHCVVLRNDDAELPSAFLVSPGTPAGKRLELSGVAIGGFSAAVLLAGGSGHYLHGNHFGAGLFSGATDLVAGDWNVLVVGDATSGVQIGGSDPAERNTVAGAGVGIQITGAGGDHAILNNYIGTARSGNASSSALRNGRGILLTGNDTLVLDNLVSGNGTGIVVEGSDNVLVSNRIGLKALAFCFDPPCPPSAFAVPNIDGVRIGGGASAATGNVFWANTVAYNSVYGVLLRPDAQHNTLTANRIHDNGFIGIDLHDPDGVSPNDNDALVLGNVANGGQNYPVLAFAGGGLAAGRVRGSLSTRPGAGYRIELFSNPGCDGSGHGEGRVYHGAATVSVPAGPVVGFNGTVQFDLALPVASGVASLDGRAITATVTDADGDTSEFSACIAYDCDQIFAHDLDSASAASCPP